ncbi:N-acetylglucosamine-6-phosphate deacetylase [Cohnella soli]|uniref:N-acetylglucosamine-6-phosphate deacetylase n=1 Tax=Cohnella soli TaxID=425005 RepID=A0ABW0HLC7_9BACL
MKWIGKRVEDGAIIQVNVINGVIETVTQLAESDLPNEPVPWISAGWIDLQVNGLAGFDFNSEHPSEEDVLGVTNQLWKLGVTNYLPTVITGSSRRISDALTIIAKACESSEEVRNSVLGIHLEGPYLAEQDGPRGAHELQYICDPDVDQFHQWQQAAGNQIKLVTLAPEKQGAVDFISKLVQEGIVVSIGHTQASTEQIEAAVVAGATVSTHLGNGSHPILPRHPNYIWDQLAEDRLWGCFIADGHHLSPNTLKAMIRSKGDKAILVSDAVKFASMPPGEYTSVIGGEVVLHESGRLHTKHNPSILAGSALSVPIGIENAIKYVGLSLVEAIEMVTKRPAAAMKLEHYGSLQKGAPANMTLFSFDPNEGKVRVMETVLAGRSVYNAD